MISVVRVNGKLGQGGVENSHMIGSGSRPGVARSQQGGECLAGGVEERHEGMEPAQPRLYVGASSLLVGGVAMQRVPSRSIT